MDNGNDNSMLVDVPGVSQELRIRPQIYVKLVKSFTSSLTGKMLLLGEALANNDRDQMRMVLHEIKGTAGNLRLRNIMGPEAVLHAAVKADGNFKMLTDYLDILRAEVEKLQQYVNRLPDGTGGAMPRILIVDDNAENRELLAEILRDMATCEFAATGSEAVTRYNQAIEGREPFDLILLDLELPEMSGLNILEKIRDGERQAGIRLGEGIPVIVVTAYQRRFLEAFDKGCDDYILKPIDAGTLVSKVTQILSKK